MPNTRMARLLDSVVEQSLAHKVAAATLAVYETQVTVDSTVGALAVTLPAVAAARGNTYSVTLLVDGGNVTVQDQDDSYGWSDITLADVGDAVLVYSDGLNWWTLASKGI